MTAKSKIQHENQNQKHKSITKNMTARQIRKTQTQQNNQKHDRKFSNKFRNMAEKTPTKSNLKAQQQSQKHNNEFRNMTANSVTQNQKHNTYSGREKSFPGLVHRHTTGTLMPALICMISPENCR